VYKATKDAVDKARKGDGPTVIELITYRLSMHTTADDPKVYRSDKEVAEWKKKDPIDRFRNYLEKKKLWSKKKEEELIAKFDERMSAAVKQAENKVNKDPSQMFKFMFEKMPWYLEEEMQEVMQENSSEQAANATEQAPARRTQSSDEDVDNEATNTNDNSLEQPVQKSTVKSVQQKPKRSKR